MSIFYEGDVQSGIALALSEDKAVVCFVRDNDAESESWESEWLLKQQHLLSRHAVSLRIGSASPEATQLAAFYPISQVPVVLVIRAGRLVDQILPGISEADFSSRLGEAVASQPEASSMSNMSTGSTTAGRSTSQTPSTSNAIPAPSDSSAPPTPAIKPDPSPTPTRSSTPSNNPRDDREARLRPQQESYMQQQARRKAEATQERQRVRALIEADKQERKAREQQRKMQAQAELPSEQEGKDKTLRAGKSTKAPRGDTATLQVRLFDGSTMRKQFKATETLQDAVRGWVGHDRSDGDSPFTFKLILTPRPSRTISDAEEQQSLGDIGLVPSASLALVPVRNFTQAYQAGGSRGFVRGAPMLILGYLAGFFSMLWSMVKRLGQGAGQEQATSGVGRHRQEESTDPNSKDEATSSAKNPEPEKPNIRIRTLRDQQSRSEDQHFYNGNQLSFEPTKKDNDNDDENSG